MKCRNLAIIGASYLQLPLIQKAKDMGYITYVFAWASNDVGEKVADYFYPISIVEKEKILEVCKKIGICGVCSIASDVAVITVNYISEKLSLCGNSISSTKKCTNKYFMRKAFEENDDPSPQCVLVDNNTDLCNLQLSYPLIVKPTDRSGSRGICKLESKEDLNKACEKAINESFENKALIEEYVKGQEYSVEYISYKGKHHFLSLTYKYTTGAPYYIEIGHMEPALIDNALLKKVKNIVEHALDTLEIKNGASHTEIKISENNTINIIEIGARMGGDCIGSHLVKYSTGYDFLKMVIDVACGKAPDYKKVCSPIKVESRFILTYDDMIELERIMRETPDKILQIVDMHPEKIGHITDSSNRAGCYIRKVDEL